MALRSRLLPVLFAIGCAASPPSRPGAGDDDDDDVTTSPPPTTGPAVDADDDGVPADEDCDDDDPDVYPGAPERCGDGRITDCRRTDEDGAITVDGAAAFDDLGEALAAAGPGSELLLCDGAFAGAVTAEVPVTVRSLRGAAETTLTGGSGTTIALPGGSALVGLTITGGGGTAGGGIRLTTAGALTVEGCDVTGNRADLGGGLSVAPGGVAVLVDTVIHDNEADEGGGGVAVGPGGVVELQGASAITDNHATWFGGGVSLDGAALIGGLVQGNAVDAELDELLEDYLDFVAPLPAGLPAATAGGAGVATTGAASVTGTEIAGNVGDGGGLSAMGGSVTLTDVSIHDNRAAVGGGVLAADTVLTAVGATEVHANQARRGAGVAAFGASLHGGLVRDNTATDAAGGVWLTRTSLAGATISGNTGAEGGGLSTEGVCSLTDVVVTGNLADQGGGMSTAEASSPGVHAVTAVRSSFDGNEAGDGGGVYAASDVTLVDTWLRDNVATSDGGGLRLYVPIHDGPDAPPPDAAFAVTVTGGGALRNVAAAGRGAGASVAAGTLTVDGADLGAGADDNTPADVSAGGALVHGYGAAASFVCSASGCTPTP